MTQSVFTLSDDGTESQVELSFSQYDAGEVYIVVDETKRIIYIWKGSSAPVRKKFISARTASKIRQHYGLTFKVDSIDQAEEPVGFLELMGSAPAASSSSSPASSGPVASARPSSAPVASTRPSGSPVASTRPSSAPVASTRPSGSPVASVRPSSVQESQPAQTQTPVSRPTPSPVQPVSKSTPQPTPQKTGVMLTKQPTTSQTVAQSKVDEIIEKIKELEVPEGLQREIVIIGQQVFSATKEFHKLFQKEVLRLDPMSDLPDGAFPASDYYTRLYLEKGEVIFVELFSEIPKTERDEFLSEVRASLRDLTKLGI
ncbi:MAG: hypothetical protein ACW981_06260 [Candidatus Hodarchaeales archaeon]